MSRTVFDPIRLTEQRLVNFDFSNEVPSGDSIATATVQAAVFSGTDPNPGAIISGLVEPTPDPTLFVFDPGAISNGTILQAMIVPQIVGVTYSISCAAVLTVSAQTLYRVGYITVIQDLT